MVDVLGRIHKLPMTKPKILVIDDEPSILSLVSEYLRREGCEVFTVVVVPIQAMMAASRRFAEGNYKERARVTGFTV
jgi:CheY-like chemotaxis protein